MYVQFTSCVYGEVLPFAEKLVFPNSWFLRYTDAMNKNLISAVCFMGLMGNAPRTVKIVVLLLEKVVIIALDTVISPNFLVYESPETMRKLCLSPNFLHQ